MSKTFVFAGASSKVAIETAKLLQSQNHQVIGISTKASTFNYNQFYEVNKYSFGTFPMINQAIDGCVYFPGTIQLKPFKALNENDFLNDYQINALGAVAFLQTYIDQLKKSSHASIVLISTVAVNVGMPYHSSISMAKGAVEGLTKSLAAELAPIIRVNCIAPSLLNTPMSDKFINTKEKLEASEKRNPLKKIGEAAQIANAIEFLLNEKSSWITGQIIGVDGGMNNLKLL